MLAKNDRVVDRHRFEQHAVGVFNRGGRHDHHTRKMRVERLEALAVKWAATGSAP